MDRRRELTMWSLCAALVVLALYSATQESFTLPDDERAVERAVQRVRSEWTQGDAVLVLPGWDDGLYADLVQPGTHGGPSFDDLIRGERVDPVRLFTDERLWVLSRYGAVNALPGILPADIVSSAIEDTGDGLTLSLVELVDAKHLAQLTDNVPALIVERRLPSGQTRACLWRNGQHRCGLQSWLNVRVEAHNVYHRDVSWLFAHAGPDHATLAVTWAEIPRSQALVIRAGFTQSGTRHKGGSPTLVRTYVDDSPQTDVWLDPHHYHQATQVISPPAGRNTMTVRIEISAADSSWRQVMLQADLFDALPATLRAVGDFHGDTP
jgi:hypothetical protein